MQEEQSVVRTDKTAGAGRQMKMVFSFMLSIMNIFIAMRLGELIVRESLVGAGTYMAGQAWVLWSGTFQRKRRNFLPARMKRLRLPTFTALCLFTLYLLIYQVIRAAFLSFLTFWVTVFLLLCQQLLPRFLPKKGAITIKMKGMLLTLYHVAILALLWLVTYHVPDREELMGAFSILFLCAAALFFLQMSALSEAREEKKEAMLPMDEVFHIASFSLFHKTVRRMVIAAVCSLVVVACYLGGINGLSAVFGWVLFLSLMTVIFGELAYNYLLKRKEYAPVTALGVASWAAACLFTLFGRLSSHIAYALLITLLMSFGIGCVCAAFRGLEEAFITLTAIETRKVAARTCRESLRITVEWAGMIAVLLFLIPVLAFGTRSGQSVDLEGFRFLFLAVLAIALLYLTLGLWNACKQPLNREYAEKIDHYCREWNEGTENTALAARLHTRLALPYRKRLGFYAVRFLVSLILPSKVVGEENIDTSHGPVVFVCNHMEIYGPLITALHMPVPVRTWIIHSMLDRRIIEESLQGGVDKVCRIFPKKIREKIPKLISPMMLWIMSSVENVPVYRGSTHEVMETMRNTVTAMQCYDNILIFPENSGAEGESGIYKLDGVSAFFSGFSKIGASYYKATGKCTTFYPMYANKSKRRIWIGEGITYNPFEKQLYEKRRIVDYLHDKMEELAKK